MSKVTVKKVALQPKAEQKQEFKSITDAMNVLNERLSKLSKDGGYDGSYGDPKDAMPKADAPEVKKSDDGDTLVDLGVEKEQAPDGGAGDYDSGYAAPVEPTKAEKPDDMDDAADGEEEDLEECMCDKCGSAYKAKKVKAEKVEQKVEVKSEVSTDIQSAMMSQLGINIIHAKKPDNVPTSVDLDSLFGRTKATSPTFKNHIDEMLMSQLGNITAKVGIDGDKSLEQMVMANLPIPAKR